MCAQPSIAARAMSSPAQRLVLLNLADRARDGTWRAWPSIERIARDTGMAPSTVRSAIRQLEKRGLVATIPVKGGKHITNEYVLMVDENPPGIGGLGDGNPPGIDSNPPGIVVKPTEDRRRTRNELTKNLRDASVRTDDGYELTERGWEEREEEAS